MTESDITSPTVLLTGPTSGIGAAMLEVLLVHQSRPRLVLLARQPSGLDHAMAMARYHGLNAQGLVVDLSDLHSLRDCLTELAGLQRAGEIAPIDVAILNAGAQFADRRKAGAQGYELTFTVNVISQHLLLRGLEPLLAPAAHVVLMGSSTHRGKKASFNLVPDPQWNHPSRLATPDSPPRVSPRPAEDRFAGGTAYATSKLALVTLAHDWAARLSATGRRLNTYDPGLVAGTGLGKDMPAYRYWVWKRLMPAMSVLPGATTANVAARHAVELAIGDAHPALRDGYVEIGRPSSAEAITFDAARRADLWGWLESAVADMVPRHLVW
jgi:NAD(P)-dependent dehydrogenase (short-subunit alcohol dehydrogenase family)